MEKATPFVGSAPALVAALDHLARLAPVERPVLVLGERGTGKELAAERLHFLSRRWQRPLLRVNCAALAEELLESELFGHEAGAFTGATRARAGRFEQADGGSLFLDELAAMSPRLQEKLLRVVEYGEFQRLGTSDTRQVDVRIIGATNVDLPAAAAEGRFRADLLDRLSFDVVALPPLRERPEDIRELAEFFAVRMSAELGRALFPGFSTAALEILEKHDWPGNVRELKNVVERSVYRWPDPEAPVGGIVIDPFPPGTMRESPRAATATTPAGPSPPAEIEPGSGPIRLREHLAAVERAAVEAALMHCAYNRAQAARSLGLSYDQLRGLLRKHGIGRTPPTGPQEPCS